ncbi:MAG: hypothetical protein H6R19_3358 [Proteobacteria bacterium]|nr:hypothetical protein [Pseudomonadota bacterium]
MKPQQSGFTLVEIAIVLVIIGLLLGGVLKGQELINSARAKSIVNDLRNTATMVTAYQDRFRALPGDDAAASSHLQNTTSAENGNGNGTIEGNFDSSTITDESSKLWAHLRRANLASGDATLANDWQPRNSDGGRIGVTSSAPRPLWQHDRHHTQPGQYGIRANCRCRPIHDLLGFLKAVSILPSLASRGLVNSTEYPTARRCVCPP